MCIVRHEDFWNRVDQYAGPDGCWPWLLSRDHGGYGRVAWDGKMHMAHRIVFLLTTGQDPTGKVVMHTCDNPPCCNPRHLRLGTQADNNADKTLKGRSRGAPGVSHPLSKLTDDIVREARARAANGESILSLSREFGVDRKTIRCAVRGTAWKHVK